MLQERQERQKRLHPFQPESMLNLAVVRSAFSLLMSRYRYDLSAMMQPTVEVELPMNLDYGQIETGGSQEQDYEVVPAHAVPEKKPAAIQIVRSHLPTAL